MGCGMSLNKPEKKILVEIDALTASINDDTIPDFELMKIIYSRLHMVNILGEKSYNIHRNVILQLIFARDMLQLTRPRLVAIEEIKDIFSRTIRLIQLRTYPCALKDNIACCKTSQSDHSSDKTVNKRDRFSSGDSKDTVLLYECKDIKLKSFYATKDNCSQDTLSDFGFFDDCHDVESRLSASTNTSPNDKKQLY